MLEEVLAAFSHPTTEAPVELGSTPAPTHAIEVTVSTQQELTVSTQQELTESEQHPATSNEEEQRRTTIENLLNSKPFHLQT